MYTVHRCFLAVAVAACAVAIPPADGLSQEELSSPCPTFDVEFSTTSGLAPLTVRVTGYVEKFQSWGIAFGDGGTVWEATNPPELIESRWIDITHTYGCPGTYQVTAGGFSGWEHCEGPLLVVDAGEPAFALSTEVSDGAVVLATSDDMNLTRVVVSGVDWGDGTDVVGFEWTENNGIHRTPAHTYDSPGHYTVTVVNSYQGERCSFVQTSTTEVQWGVKTPVESATWGRVKTLYAE